MHSVPSPPVAPATEAPPELKITIERTTSGLAAHIAAWEQLLVGLFPLVFDQTLVDKAQTFQLTPGDGVHVPVNAPHDVLNGPQASVSFSTTFRTPEGDRRSAVYEVNDRLRRFGLKPRPVGKQPLVDRAKYVGYALYVRAQKRLGRG